MKSSSLVWPGDSKCAKCLKVKPLPLRRDEMGGYVCLTCVDKELNTLFDERAKSAKLLAALKEAREAMEERRLYGDAWEYKHGKRWDKEDSAIDAVIKEVDGCL